MFIDFACVETNMKVFGYVDSCVDLSNADEALHCGDYETTQSRNTNELHTIEERLFDIVPRWLLSTCKFCVDG
jgi:hypothetical protein